MNPREEELIKAIQYLSTLLSAYSILLIDVTQKFDEIGTSFVTWQKNLQKIQEEYGMDLEQVLKLIDKSEGYQKGKEYLN